ncbi:MAG TPA: protein kinase [Polyangiaceae bacterium]|nr:protein kinase [Polyangiaceae bacterium]
MAAPPSLLDDGQPSSGSPLQIGQVVCGKYRIERQIGRGGMGIVLAATHLQLGHLVAIKVMRRDLVADDRALDRLLIEARAAARIRSEHVARVLDVGMLDSGSPFIVMEYLEGENLADLLDRLGALDIDQAAAFLMQCCLALAEVHVADMVHRDLKPGNIFIARRLDGSPTVKIVDFGISKYIGDARERGATTSPQVLGSPFYMSPEQMRAERVDARSDIWGLGAILFEMLTGRPPFLGDTLPAVYSAVLNHSPPQVDSLRPGVPTGLDDVVQRCLEKDPARRFGDVAALAEALAPYAGAMAPAVDRITRILANPDAARARFSLPPERAAAARGGGEEGGAERLPPPLVVSGVVNGEASMAADWEPEGGGVEPGGVPATMIESEPRLGLSPPPPDVSWQPSRPANTGELAPLSATGARAKSPRSGRGWLIGLGAGAALVLAGALLWPRSEPPEPPPRAAAIEPPAAPVEGPSQPTPLPRVTPLAGNEPVADPAAAGPVTAVRALRPQPPAKSAARATSRPSGTDPSSSLWSVAGTSPTRVSEPPPKPSDDEGSAQAETPAPATPRDAWDPDSFGERR